jgi:regulator of sigma E protease
MTILLFLVILLVTVLVHEWGHFFAAKKSGMLVEEFGFGIPPKLWSWKKGETTYSLNALPIGGFVKIAGENGEESGVAPERQFESKPWYTKSIVLLAGVIMNVVLAMVLFTVAYMSGLPAVTPAGTPTVTSVVAGAPAALAGLAAGDTIESILVDGIPVKPIETTTLHDAIQKSRGSVIVTYTHAGAVHTATVTPTVSGSNKMIGISIDPISIVKQSLWHSIGSAWYQVTTLSHDILSTLGTLVAGLLSGKGSVSGLMGPVGLAKAVGSAATFGFAYLLAFTATISINLAVLNAMPFPALDGGRLVVVWGEAITGRKFSSTTVGIIHAVGFVLLLVLMIVLTIGDIRHKV